MISVGMAVRYVGPNEETMERVGSEIGRVVGFEFGQAKVEWPGGVEMYHYDFNLYPENAEAPAPKGGHSD